MKILVILFFAMLSSGLYAQSVIVNPDGTHPNGTHSILAKQGDFQQMTVRSNSANQPIIIKKRGGKLVILPDGSVIHFEKMKRKRKDKI